LERIMPRLGVTEHDEMDCDDLTLEPETSHDLEPELIRKQKLEEQAFEPRKTHGICTNYKHLNNSFLVEEDDEITFLVSNETYAVIAGDELNTLREVDIC
jgi:hypothetical protein